MKVGNIEIGGGHTFVIAEIGSNHEQDYEKSEQLILAAKEAGADAVKLQTYTPDSMTLDCGKEPFQIKDGLWAGQSLYQLYEKTAMPLEWQPKLKHYADLVGITLFSTPFSPADVDFLEMMDVVCYKLSSFDIANDALIKAIAATGKPTFISTGGAKEYWEISRATRTIDRKNCAVLHCVSAYPALPEKMSLRTIGALSTSLGIHCGLSDHSKGIAIAIAAVAVDARIIEKHIKLPNSKGLDAEFSITSDEFKTMVDAIRIVEKSVSGVAFKGSPEGHKYRPSCWAARDIRAGEEFTRQNVRYIRPNGWGVENIETILNKKAALDISYGTPILTAFVDEE